MFLLTIYGREGEGAYSVVNEYGEKILYLFEEEDDAESIRIAIHKFNESKELLNELKASGATLREVMALEISIKGTENWLKANNHI